MTENLNATDLPTLRKLSHLYRTWASEPYSIDDEQQAGWQLITRTTADTLDAFIEELSSRQPIANACPYTFSHTRSWCGNEGCRAS